MSGTPGSRATLDGQANTVPVGGLALTGAKDDGSPVPHDLMKQSFTFLRRGTEELSNQWRQGFEALLQEQEWLIHERMEEAMKGLKSDSMENDDGSNDSDSSSSVASKQKHKQDDKDVQKNDDTVIGMLPHSRPESEPPQLHFDKINRTSTISTSNEVEKVSSLGSSTELLDLPSAPAQPKLQQPYGSEASSKAHRAIAADVGSIPGVPLADTEQKPSGEVPTHTSFASKVRFSVELEVAAWGEGATNEDNRVNPNATVERSPSLEHADSVTPVPILEVEPTALGPIRSQNSTAVRRASSRAALTLVDMEEATPSWLKRASDSDLFNYSCLVMIIANAVFVGLSCQHSLGAELDRFQGRAKDSVEDPIFNFGEWAFCGFFTFELIFRFVAAPSTFILGPDWKWNAFDFALVLNCLADLLLQELLGSLTFIRVLRILRMGRILRIIRVVRFFRALRLMVYSIIHSLVSLLWVFIILFFAIYLVSIFVANSLIAHLKDRTETGIETEMLINLFGSLQSTLVTLFQAICGGRDWWEIYHPLYFIHPVCGWLLLVYIFFVVFGVLNVVTGAFVDSMRQVSEQDKDLQVENELHKLNDLKSSMQKIFEEADADSSGTLSWEEFETHLEDARVKAYFRTLQIDVTQAQALFMLLDIDEDGEVPIDQFVDRCMRLRGEAKSIDVNMLLYETEKMLSKVTDFVHYAEDKFESIEKKLENQAKRFLVGVAPEGNGRRGAVTNTNKRRPSVNTVSGLSNSGAARRQSVSVNSRLDTAANLLANLRSEERSIS